MRLRSEESKTLSGARMQPEVEPKKQPPGTCDLFLGRRASGESRNSPARPAGEHKPDLQRVADLAPEGARAVAAKQDSQRQRQPGATIGHRYNGDRVRDEVPGAC